MRFKSDKIIEYFKYDFRDIIIAALYVSMAFLISFIIDDQFGIINDGPCDGVWSLIPLSCYYADILFSIIAFLLPFIIFKNNFKIAVLSSLLFLIFRVIMGGIFFRQVYFYMAYYKAFIAILSVLLFIIIILLAFALLKSRKIKGF